MQCFNIYLKELCFLLVAKRSKTRHNNRAMSQTRHKLSKTRHNNRPSDAIS